MTAPDILFWTQYEVRQRGAMASAQGLPVRLRSMCLVVLALGEVPGVWSP